MDHQVRRLKLAEIQDRLHQLRQEPAVVEVLAYLRLMLDQEVDRLTTDDLKDMQSRQGSIRILRIMIDGIDKPRTKLPTQE